MKTIGLIHYYNTGTVFKVLEVIRDTELCTEVIIYNHHFKIKQKRRIMGYNRLDQVITLYSDLKNVQVGGINHKDAPDYVDAFIEYAENSYGTPLSDEELEDIDSETVYDYVMKKLY